MSDQTFLAEEAARLENDPNANVRVSAETARLEEMITRAADDSNASFPVKFTVGVGEFVQDYELSVRWPLVADQTMIDNLFAAFCGEVNPQFMSGEAEWLAKGRALIEVLAVPTPGVGFPEWIIAPPPGSPTFVRPNGSRALRLDSGLIRSKWVVINFAQAFVGLERRFQHLA